MNPMKWSRPRIESAPLRIAVIICVVIATLAASVFVWRRLPYATDVAAPFEVRGSAGTVVSGRLFSVTVTKAGIAPVVKHTGAMPKARNLQARGQWIVVKATVTSLIDAHGASARLVLDGKVFLPDDRLRYSTLDAALLSPLIPLTGVYVFEVPTDSVDRSSHAQLGIIYQEPKPIPEPTKWDSALLIDIPIDAQHAPRAAVIALPANKAGAS
ncbi:Uncharacterised protein [Mycobacteroides abscessus subsp. abscessus]|uniref:DUF4352 domain-containing protein n=4 Tax=Mycobacteroides abscessus TaxID=36809 RepID=B1MB05_MYCA9|nr:hypothetical protein [Mycobacteroides abscessus]AKP58218.1 hypothetical protein MAUC22_11665 [Mycobacteroides abscessus UC22]EIU57141.1 hypothetical protein MA6G0728S_2176 [Mycobacteroides abscessus 6G-0728-S]OLT57059.1 hypothetical protein BKG55_20785 [Mycobacteroides abscessus ATCC 19977]ALM16640.1 hypothetical protein AOY11_10615 [Mycobacteroides abscessus]AMU45839.1 hypothetical protein A3O00_11780 [Mycobacteroides abscessus]